MCQFVSCLTADSGTNPEDNGKLFTCRKAHSCNIDCGGQQRGGASPVWGGGVGLAMALAAAVSWISVLGFDAWHEPVPFSTGKIISRDLSSPIFRGWGFPWGRGQMSPPPEEAPVDVMAPAGFRSQYHFGIAASPGAEQLRIGLPLMLYDWLLSHKGMRLVL